MEAYTIKDKIILVTGASRGIGRAIAVEAARRGAKAVVINYKSGGVEARETARLVEEAGARALAYRADIASWSQAKSMVDSVIGELGGLDVVVNNAGILRPKPFREMDPSDWEEMFKVHVFGSMNIARAAIDYMREGVIVNISSVLALRPEEEASHYSAAKAALVAWSIALARELAPHIRVFTVLPGGVDTRMARAWGSLDWVEEQVPLARLARPQEIAKLVMDAVENPYITGDILTISGGLL